MSEKVKAPTAATLARMEIESLEQKIEDLRCEADDKRDEASELEAEADTLDGRADDLERRLDEMRRALDADEAPPSSLSPAEEQHLKRREARFRAWEDAGRPSPFWEWEAHKAD